MRLASLLVLLTASGSLVIAGETPASRDSLAHKYDGLLFEFRVVPQYEAAHSVVERGEIVLLGPGYPLSRTCLLNLLFATGSRELEPSATRPVNGRFGFGGARLEMTCFLACDCPIRPFCSAGAGLYSIINDDGVGYNGNGFNIGAGVGWEPTDFFRSKLGLEYESMRFFNEVGRPVGPFETFTLNSLGISVSVSFVPGIVP